MEALIFQPQHAVERANLVFVKIERLLGKKNYDSFLWIGFICLKATKPLRRDFLLFTAKYPEGPATHLLDFGRMKGWVDLGATLWFWTWDLWICNPAPKPLCHCSIIQSPPLQDVLALFSRTLSFHNPCDVRTGQLITLSLPFLRRWYASMPCGDTSQPQW